MHLALGPHRFEVRTYEMRSARYLVNPLVDLSSADHRAGPSAWAGVAPGVG